MIEKIFADIKSTSERAWEFPKSLYHWHTFNSMPDNHSVKTKNEKIPWVKVAVSRGKLQQYNSEPFSPSRDSSTFFAYSYSYRFKKNVPRGVLMCWIIILQKYIFFYKYFLQNFELQYFFTILLQLKL